MHTHRIEVRSNVGTSVLLRRAALGLFGVCALSMVLGSASAAPSQERGAKATGETAMQAEPTLPAVRAEAAGPEVALPGRVPPCPHPLSTTIVSTGLPQGPAGAGGQFPANIAQASMASGLGDMRANHTFAYTFKWDVPKERCCEILAARITLVVKCHDDIPDNDAWGLFRNGAAIYSGGAIGWPSNCSGQTKTISVSLPTSVVGFMNTDNQLSVLVEDDTAVMSAKLEMSGCCVTRYRAMY